MPAKKELINDLINNEDFIYWVLYNDTTQDKYWNEYINEDLGQGDAVTEARIIVLNLQQAEQTIDVKETVVDEIWTRIESSLQSNNKTGVGILKMRTIKWWAAAASVALVALSIWVYRASFKSLAGNETIAALNKVNYTNRKNTTSVDIVLLLADGSKVFLKPNSSLGCSKIFNGLTRDVYLDGEAFFEVAKDAKHPFFVHTKNITTKVLGTSFLVQDVAGKEITVAVKTGKVSVFIQNAGAHTQTDTTILLPNQQAVFNNRLQNITKEKVTDTSLIMAPVFVSKGFDFEDTPLSKVFSSIEKTYQVNIIYNKEKYAGSRLNASLGDEPLTNKIEVICKAINATYTIDGDNINIK